MHDTDTDIQTDTAPAAADAPAFEVPDDFEVPVHRVDREVYAMPAFVTLPVRDLDAARGWYEALGFVVLAEMGGGAARLLHLRRYRYQDILLVPAGPGAPTADAGGAAADAMLGGIGPRASFCHSGPTEELTAVAEALAAQGGGTVEGPAVTPWHALELVATDTDGHVVVLTARPDTPPPAALVAEVRGSLVDPG